MTDPIKAKIQELLPDLDWDKERRTDGMWKQDITLAVVLRAIGREKLFKPIQIHDSIVGSSLNWIIEMYDLEHDNYDQQSHECKQFIGSLLGV